MLASCMRCGVERLPRIAVTAHLISANDYDNNIIYYLYSACSINGQ